MRNVFSQLWNDDNGVVGLEYLVLATIIGLGLIVGVTTVAIAVATEYNELAQSITNLNQGWTSDTFTTCVASKQGASTADQSTYLGDVITTPATTVQIDDDLCD
jgi:Flp pilus assembly pilin Flp